MQKTQKEKAIKQLQTEMKEEKQAEIRRCVELRKCGLTSINCPFRRKEITMERKKAAEERRRLEEEKAKVSTIFTSRKRSRWLIVFFDLRRPEQT